MATAVQMRSNRITPSITSYAIYTQHKNGGAIEPLKRCSTLEEAIEAVDYENKPSIPKATLDWLSRPVRSLFLSYATNYNFYIINSETAECYVWVSPGTVQDSLV